jgi:hypothetical protein
VHVRLAVAGQQFASEGPAAQLWGETWTTGKPAFNAMQLTDHAGTGAARALGNGRKLMAIRNAPRPMPHAPIYSHA